MTYIFLVSVLWAMITPIGAVPDEPAHITYSASVVRGHLGTLTAVNHPIYSKLAVVVVPEWVATITDPPRSTDAYPYPCYAFDRAETAACSPRLSAVTTVSQVPTTVWLYPPPYYWVVGLPTLFMAGEPAIYTMRVVSAALAASMIALGLLVASPSRRRWLALGAMLASTPMVTHLAGSVNPSGLEISAAMGLGIALMGIVANDTSRNFLKAAAIVALAFAVAWARPATHLTLIAVISASALINPRQLLAWLRPPLRSAVVGVGLLSLIGTLLAFRSFAARLIQAAVVPALKSAPATAANSALVDPLYGLTGNLHELERRSIDWGTDLIGRLGWVDHTPPIAVTVAWLLAIIALVIVAVTWASRRDRVSLLLITAGALIIAPLFVISVSLNAGVYQARYHLALATLIVIAAATILSRSRSAERRRLGWSILSRSAAFAPAATVVTVLGSLYRYGVGGQATVLDALSAPFVTKAWTPPATEVAIAVLVGTAAVVLGRAISSNVGTGGIPPEMRPLD